MDTAPTARGLVAELPSHGFIRYRPDIDGLRGIAVLCVVVYHTMPYVLHGGFVGVDIFFVISGYLISGQIFAEIRDRHFSLVAFYGRRIRRIFPALILVLACTLAYGFVLLLPAELAGLGADTAGGAAFISNIMLWHEAGYFDRAAIFKPLLHLWSLGVEEQFYIFWPLLLLATHKLALLRFRLLLLLTASSLMACILLATKNPTADFYAPFARFWELSAGAMLAWRHASFRCGSRCADALSITGLALILGSTIGLSSRMVFPGWWAIIPVLGTVLLIGAGPSASVNHTLLGRRALRFFGFISYPLYLWHWPLISYCNFLDHGRQFKTVPALGVIAAAILLAAPTYLWIERPLRTGSLQGVKTLCLAAAMLVVGAAGAFTWEENGFPGRYRSLPSVDPVKINAAMQDGVFNTTPHMHVTKIDGITVGELGNAGSAIMFSGDSLLFHWDARVEELLDEDKLRHRVYFIVAPSCWPIPGVNYAPDVAYCANLPAIQAKIIREENIGTIVIGAYWQAAFASSNGTRLYGKLESEIAGWTQNGHTVYLILPLPGGPGFDPAQMVTRNLTGFTVNSARLAPLTMAALKADLGPITNQLTILAKRSGARTLDPLPDICGTGLTCSPFLADGQPKFVDDKHLRPGFVQHHITFFDFLLTR